ncbi:uncharacterized protein LOC135485473 [Lineus longissimus]|uniref:uncharacterized protein LOC135485473 n=1 Tax=Lineus longissimus TaxID=88925 RepID=UPI002B4DD2DB
MAFRRQPLFFARFMILRLFRLQVFCINTCVNFDVSALEGVTSFNMTCGRGRSHLDCTATCTTKNLREVSCTKILEASKERTVTITGYSNFKTYHRPEYKTDRLQAQAQLTYNKNRRMFIGFHGSRIAQIFVMGSGQRLDIIADFMSHVPKPYLERMMGFYGNGIIVYAAPAWRQTKQPHQILIGFRYFCGKYVIRTKPHPELYAKDGSSPRCEFSVNQEKLVSYCKARNSSVRVTISSIVISKKQFIPTLIKSEIVQNHTKKPHILWISDTDFIVWFGNILEILVFRKINEYAYFRLMMSFPEQFKFTDVLFDDPTGSILLVTANQRMAWVESEYVSSDTTKMENIIRVRGHVFNTQLLSGCAIGSCFLDGEGNLLHVIFYFPKMAKEVLRVDVYKPQHSYRRR